jgi:hypothetical protein
MKEKILFFFGAAILLLVISLMIGGIYAVTPPNGAVDTAYKVNRFTGKVWLIKTYDKQVGALRVLAAREAAVEPTKALNDDPTCRPLRPRPIKSLRELPAEKDKHSLATCKLHGRWLVEPIRSAKN